MKLESGTLQGTAEFSASDAENEIGSAKRAMILPTVESSRPRVASKPRKSRLWLWFLAAFFVQAAMWTAWLVIAAHHRVEEVPLVSERPGTSAPKHPTGSDGKP
jgi:hypothetical protein